MFVVAVYEIREHFTSFRPINIPLCFIALSVAGIDWVEMSTLSSRIEIWFRLTACALLNSDKEHIHPF